MTARLRRFAPFPLAEGLAALFLVAAGSQAQQPPRDNLRPAGHGTARLSGVIVTDDAAHQPLRRVRVTLKGVELESALTAITDDDGSYVFEGLPPGRYSLSASKAGYVAMSYGARRVGRPGRTLLLENAERRRVRLPLPKGGVITGTLLTPESEPAAGVAVTALAYRSVPETGERRLAETPNGTVTTDDRGVYRIFGLSEGTYVISASPRRDLQAMTDLQVLSEREIRAALAQVREQRTQARPGMPAPLPPAIAIPGERRNVALTPIFYPGTALQSRAVPVTVAAGEVRHGVDFDLEYVATATIEGIVSTPPGIRVVLTIADAERTAPLQTTRIAVSPGEDGTFEFRRIPPGTYTITARGLPSGARLGAVPAQTPVWGEASVVVSGDDISGIAVDLGPTVSISGRVVFEGTAPPPESLPLRVQLRAVPAGGTSGPPLPSVIVAGFTFSVAGIVPGTYSFPSPPQGSRTPIGRWWLKSVMVNRRELLDAKLELRQSADDGVVTFSDRASEVSGVVHAGDGAPFVDGFVVIFPAQKSAWFHGSRRVAGIAPAPDGRYAVRNLPPGEYFVAFSTDLEMNEWFDPDVLAALAPTASVISLAEHESRRHDIQVPR
jgi:hypothetical protein